ncbi:universal stress protein [Maritimibacter sp. 55A14]|uniref:universal stress protein n=1 Tax=Maritimibacter sp. 55A14 TaxID=2174844 RepID=UPI000D608BF0|nr:universal stress protein [Maritimibacter sp. 55A14]PWE29390.1 universal stress protein [Maritimibacter sp. 55A14]
MTKQILVATDGSKTAGRAVAFASEMAARFEVPLTILHVLHHDRPPQEMSHMADVEHMLDDVTRRAEPDFVNTPGTMADLFRASTDSDKRARLVMMIGDHIVDNAAEDARKAGVTSVDTRVADGDPVETILDTAQDVGADMIVVGSRGLGGLKGLLLGSVSDKVSRHAPCTVTTVR